VNSATSVKENVCIRTKSMKKLYIMLVNSADVKKAALLFSQVVCLKISAVAESIVRW
jgi:hypothetical protein